MGMLKAMVRDVLRPRRAPDGLRAHLDAAMQWMARAQDASGCDGVARSYGLRVKPSHGRAGWLPAYPETTGYIIPTFLEYARRFDAAPFRERALRMAHWETAVQMPEGAVQGGTIDFPPTPAVFNTGQVLFGWTSAFQETGDEAHRAAARRAADFLVGALDPDGAWRRHGSRFARGGVHTYDARSAWGLALAGTITSDPAHREGAMRNLDFALTQQRANGWFAHCCLDDEARPLLHTLAYAMEGCLEGGVLLEEPRYVQAARRAADSLLQRQRRDGSLAGRFDSEWRDAAGWSCLTGDAQTSIVWLRLHELTGEPRYLEAALRMNRFLAGIQVLDAGDPGISGGIKGSQPIWAEYGPFEYLNWAAKFFADALLLELRLTSSGDR